MSVSCWSPAEVVSLDRGHTAQRRRKDASFDFEWAEVAVVGYDESRGSHLVRFSPPAGEKRHWEVSLFQMEYFVVGGDGVSLTAKVIKFPYEKADDQAAGASSSNRKTQAAPRRGGARESADAHAVTPVVLIYSPSLT